MVDTQNPVSLGRRHLLALTAAGSLAAVAGCLGDEDVPDPIALDDGQSCDQCNMQIANHPGPVGQAYYLDDAPEREPPADREDGLAHFCSSWCTYMYVRENEERDAEPAGIYVTDYANVEYELFEDAGATVISAHLEADDFARADELTFTVDSDVEGSMGPSLIGFSDSADAEAFQDEHGGMLLDHDDITLETVGSL